MLIKPHALSWIYICGWITLSNGRNKEVIWIIPKIYGQNVGFWSNGVSMYGITPTVMQLVLNKYHPALSWMYIWGWITLSNGPNKEVIWIIPIFLVNFGQNVGFWPPGSLCMGLPPTVMQLILNKYHHTLSWMYICGCFVLSKCPNREVLWIIPMFGVIFGQNMGIWPPVVVI